MRGLWLILRQLADFGLARQIINDSNECGHEIWIYNPPERLIENKYDIMSDVYSFAICMWEIATRSVPYAELEENDKYYKIIDKNNKFVDLIKVKNAICAGLRPTFNDVDDGCPPEYIELIEECWSTNRDDRPTFAEILSRLRKILGFPDTPDPQGMLQKKKNKNKKKKKNKS